MPRRKPPVRPDPTDADATEASGRVPAQAAVDGVPAPEPPHSTEPAPTAFELFVQRGLHAIYDGVLAEPIPDELLRLIEDDRRKE